MYKRALPVSTRGGGGGLYTILNWGRGKTMYSRNKIGKIFITLHEVIVNNFTLLKTVIVIHIQKTKMFELENKCQTFSTV